MRRVTTSTQLITGRCTKALIATWTSVRTLPPQERQRPRRLSSVELGQASSIPQSASTRGSKSRDDRVGLGGVPSTSRQLPQPSPCWRTGLAQRIPSGETFRSVSIERAPQLLCSPPTPGLQRHKRHWILWPPHRSTRRTQGQPVQERRHGRTYQCPPRKCAKEEGLLQDLQCGRVHLNQREYSSERI